MKFTTKEIMNLASFAGFNVSENDIDPDQLETEIEVHKASYFDHTGGLFDEDRKEKIKIKGIIAYFAEYPEEGFFPVTDQ